MGVQVPQHHLLKRLSFSSLKCLAPLSKINWPYIDDLIFKAEIEMQRANVWMPREKWGWWDELEDWNWHIYCCSGPVMSESLWPRGLKHTRLACPSPSPRACSNSCPLSRWCHPFLLLPSIFPRIRVYSNESALHIRWPNNGVSASALVFPMTIQDWLL